jgi:hypothetical protein
MRITHVFFKNIFVSGRKYGPNRKWGKFVPYLASLGLVVGETETGASKNSL